MKKIVITGGAGFIGSAVVRHLIENTDDAVIVYDKLTYAGNLDSLARVSAHSRYSFVQGDICDPQKFAALLDRFQPDAIMNLAAESHVDKSIDGPAVFMETNVLGTFHLLQESKKYWMNLPGPRKDRFRFHHVSTDEVYGDLEGTDDLFTESTAYDPSSPYSASKAASDHLVRAWERTYGLPTIVTNCSNNYGPYHFPEKLIPLMILNALAGRPLPVYGTGDQIRDWLYVEDHARALCLVLDRGKTKQTYNIGGRSERRNIDVVRMICSVMGELRPGRAGGGRYEELITFVEDRPGHDFRYAIDSSKIENELGWKPSESFESGIRKTVQWYLSNEPWWRGIQDKSYLRRQGL